MKQFLWTLVAGILRKPMVFNWLKRRAERNPYFVITDKTGKKIYMWRGWIFNRYDRTDWNDGSPRFIGARWSWLPSIRLHHIRLPDEDRHFHDHPWDARTIILRGWYGEKYPAANGYGMSRTRVAGQTHTLKVGQYHRIVDLSPGGVWTLFITWKYEDVWGFLVNGQKIPHKRYLQIREIVATNIRNGDVAHGMFNNEVERLCNLYISDNKNHE